ncbi:agrin-like [Dreissena polymorpha]|nr:agrin-like [Dreissena polymorpha]
MVADMLTIHLLILLGLIEVAGSECVAVSCIDPSLGVLDYQSCLHILPLPCTSGSEVCGSDGVTYATRCHFAKAHCVSASITFAHNGPCVGMTSYTTLPTTSATTATTMKTTTSGHTSPLTTNSLLASTTQSISDILMEVFCHNLPSINCNTGFNVVCGSDGNLYPNECEFSKALCHSPGLKMMTEISSCVQS